MGEGFRDSGPALLATSLGLLAHPAILPRLRGGEELQFVLAALSVGLIVALFLSARTPADRLVAAGACAVLLGIGYDAARGHHGTLTLGLGEPVHLFAEQGPNGTNLGLRPLGAEVRLERLDGNVAQLALPGGTVVVRPGEAARAAGFTLSAPTLVATGDTTRLRLAVTEAGHTAEIDLVPPEVAIAGDLEIALDRYFPDFALDAKGQPYSRSAESLNPAALLKVRSPSGLFSIFVIRSLPGIHSQPGLDASFALLSVDPAVALHVVVSQEPMAPLCLLGILVAACGIALRIVRP